MTATNQHEATKAFGTGVDFGRTASDYRKFRAGFPEQFFNRLARQELVQPGQKAIDLGTGTGTIARGLARFGLDVIGIDPAESLLHEASQIDQAEKLKIEYRVGCAEQLEFPDCSIDLVVAGQCWHWLDRKRAAEEAFRVLKPNGALVIAHFDWLPVCGNVVEATEALILEANPAWTMSGGTGLYPQWLVDMANAGFIALETCSFDVMQPYSHEAWCGRIKASAGISASLGEAATATFVEKLRTLLRSSYPQDPLTVPHRVWWAIGRRAAINTP